MKKKIAKKGIRARGSAQTGLFVAKSHRGRSTSKVAKGLDPINYAKVISYIVKTEEDETRMMVAASGSISSH